MVEGAQKGEGLRFLSVTLPSLLVMIALLFLLCCCTRPDSIICKICEVARSYPKHRLPTPSFLSCLPFPHVLLSGQGDREARGDLGQEKERKVGYWTALSSPWSFVLLSMTLVSPFRSARSAARSARASARSKAALLDEEVSQHKNCTVVVVIFIFSVLIQLLELRWHPVTHYF